MGKSLVSCFFDSQCTNDMDTKSCYHATGFYWRHGLKTLYQRLASIIKYTVHCVRVSDTHDCHLFHSQHLTAFTTYQHDTQRLHVILHNRNLRSSCNIQSKAVMESDTPTHYIY